MAKVVRIKDLLETTGAPHTSHELQDSRPKPELENSRGSKKDSGMVQPCGNIGELRFRMHFSWVQVERSIWRLEEATSDGRISQALEELNQRCYYLRIREDDYVRHPDVVE